MDWKIVPGKIKNTYRLLTTVTDKDHKQPAGWGLATWQLHGGKRNGGSSWVYTHAGDHWPMDWTFQKTKCPAGGGGGGGGGPKPGKCYCIKTSTTHQGSSGRQPAGWGLAAWHAHGAVRNGASSWVAVHSGNKWPMIWKVAKGTKPGTLRF